ncbi:MAG: phosphoribosylformylglycinamidine synthase, partial [Tissierellia bacterium]|nr:phosphoribosylformylglycinamidine synthase [Tissierellia bacterium]
ELKMLETYWSDHCRHTTFNTEIDDIAWEEGPYKNAIEQAFKSYLSSREYAFGDKEKSITLMDLATINAREISKKGLLEDKEKSDEVNAASIEVEIEVNGKPEQWLLMFKNETHNHPTEIEPFGGASTCLGGGIRDPLSGRAFVYQAMRLTGCGNPHTPWNETLDGKLAQRKITKTAMEGYSSYGYQIGGSTGNVKEFYHDGFVAKRMELGALVAATPKDNVTRGTAEPGDVIILLGGRTGRDGLGAAVGSSKKHTEDSLHKGGTDVQKGNPLIERRIIRLFRRPEASKLIKVCNDFGAGGVSVAIGELADGLHIDLNAVPVKYPGMNGTEIALSESQERMAVVLSSTDVDEFLMYAAQEDCEATIVARVTEEPYVTMVWNDQTVVNISREFINTNGTVKHTKVKVLQPESEYFTKNKYENVFIELKEKLSSLNEGSQADLNMAFDTSVGGGTVFLPYGGSNRLTAIQGMVGKFPVEEGYTNACSVMSFGYNPQISSWSPFHGGYYAVLESLARLTVLGGDPEKARLTFQEYFERLGTDAGKWGKPFQALLGAFLVQKAFDAPSIGGKDSMSGTFEDISVPPTLVSFAVGATTVERVVSPELKKAGNTVIWIHNEMDENHLLNLSKVKENYEKVRDLIKENKVYAAMAVEGGGVIATLSKMALGNGIGVNLINNRCEDWFTSYNADILLEVESEKIWGEDAIVLGHTVDSKVISFNGENLDLDELISIQRGVLNPIFGVNDTLGNAIEKENFVNKAIDTLKTGKRPLVVIPVFFGTHGEYTLKQKFIDAGADVELIIFKDHDIDTYEDMVSDFASFIDKADILALPDGCVYGNEPETGGKFLTMLLKRDEIINSVNRLIDRKGLVLGVGDGFTGLLKAGYFEDELGSAPNSFMSYHVSGRFNHTLSHIKIQTNASPWTCLMKAGDVFTAPVATQMGRFISSDMAHLLANGLVAGRFVGPDGKYGDGIEFNPTGSEAQVESLLSKNGQIFGTISAIDRTGIDLYKNREIYGEHKIFESAVHYFMN